MDLVKNLGRREVNSASYISKKIFQLWRYLSNFNLPGKSRKNAEHHYDIGGEKGEKLYDIFLDKKLMSLIRVIPDSTSIIFFSLS